MASVRPMKIPGRWRDGYALDFHTLSSTYLGDNEYGQPQFETTRSELGELLYRLKYRLDQSAIPEIVETAASFIGAWNPGVDMLVPVPPSRSRSVQPVLLLADALARRLRIELAVDTVRKVKDIPELKGIYDYGERLRLLEGAHEVNRSRLQGRRVLLFDDLYRSGATMNAITAAIEDQGGAAAVFALTITRTRSRV